MIQVTGIVTSTTANVLAGSDLQSAPGPGVAFLWIASTQADTRISFGAPPTIASRNITPFIRTNGVPLCSDDSPVGLACRGGEQIVASVTVVTGCTCGYVVKFIPENEV